MHCNYCLPGSRHVASPPFCLRSWNKMQVGYARLTTTVLEQCGRRQARFRELWPYCGPLIKELKECSLTTVAAYFSLIKIKGLYTKVSHNRMFLKCLYKQVCIVCIYKIFGYTMLLLRYAFMLRRSLGCVRMCLALCLHCILENTSKSWPPCFVSDAR